MAGAGRAGADVLAGAGEEEQDGDESCFGESCFLLSRVIEQEKKQFTGHVECWLLVVGCWLLVWCWLRDLWASGSK